MNEENNLGINSNASAPVDTNPVVQPPDETPVPDLMAPPAQPVESAPVETPAPVEMPTPVESAPVEAPVAETQAPDLMAPPVAETPVETEAPVDITPVEPTTSAPVETPDLMAPPTPEPKKNNTVFLVIVIVLIVAILGLAVYIVMNLGGKSGNTGTTTTTTTKGNELITSTKEVTTRGNTTTAVRTTKGSDTATPVGTSSKTLKIGYYNVPLPNGYEAYSDGSLVQAVSTADKAILAFQAVKYDFTTLVNSQEEIEASLQSQGFDILDASSGYYGSRPWAVLQLGGSQVKTGFHYYYLITPLDDNTTVEVYAYIAATEKNETNLIPMLTSMLDAKTQAFAESEADIDEKFDTSILDALDERLIG